MKSRSIANRVKQIALMLFAVTAFFSLPQLGGWACDTPVYRFAMYRWQPKPHEVYFFHDGKIDPQNAKVGKAIRQASEKKGAAANIVYLPVNLSEDTELATVPPDVKKAFQDRKDSALPTYMTVTPQGIQTYSGKLQASDVAAMTDSPARRKMAQLIKEGCACVFVLLTIDDRAANIKAEQVLTQLAKDIKEGKIDLYAGPADQFPDNVKKEGEKKDKEAKEEKPQHKIGVVKVARDDKAEQWFVRNLLAVRDRNELDDDLRSDNRPMAFPVYGRARALPPYIGPGINRDNMIGVVEFVIGPCSCTVQEQNPGVNLLIAYDWEAAADALTEIYGSEEGNEKQFSAEDLFPDLIIGPTTDIEDPQPRNPDDPDTSTDPETGADPQTSIDPDTGADPKTGSVPKTVTDPPLDNEPKGSGDSSSHTPNISPVGIGDPTPDPAGNDDKQEPGDTEAVAAGDPPAENTKPDDGDPAKEKAAGREVASNTPAPEVDDTKKAGGNLSVWTVGLGILIGLVGLFVTTFLIIRPR